jgi:hypothetical protein
MILAQTMATSPDVDLAKIDGTTEQDIRRQMREDGYDPDEEHIISPVIQG